jgi:transcription elongation GreA/GreB family factor
MSKAFTREDIDPPERSGRVRSASGLPPGATNYITRRGAQHLQTELAKLRSAELERVFTSITIVDPPDTVSDSVAFGATVTVEDEQGATETFTVVGVDELAFYADAVSWISPIGKTLLAAELGDTVTLGNDKGRRVKIAKIEYRTESPH